MKPLEIKAARVRLGLSVRYMASELGISEDSYYKKERGDVRFSDNEKIKVACVLGLSAQQINDGFFGGQLPIT